MLASIGLAEPVEGRTKPVLKELPVGGDWAQENEFHVPLAFGLGAGLAYFDQDMPVTSFEVGFGSRMLDSTDAALVGRRSRDTLVMGRADVWLLQFVNLYGVFGFANSTMDYELMVPAVAFDAGLRDQIEVIDGISVPVDLEFPIRIPGETIDFDQDLNGPVYGAGILIGGDWRRFYGTLDLNYIRAEYDDSLGFANGDLDSFTFTPRVGCHFDGPGQGSMGRVWVGTMYMDAEKEIRGEIPIRDLDPGIADAIGDFVAFKANSEVKSHWNFLIGGQWAIAGNWVMSLEGGFGDREQVMGSIATRF